MLMSSLQIWRVLLRVSVIITNCQMWNHFVLASQKSQNSSNIPTPASSPAFNLRARKETVVIDLITFDDASLPQCHAVGHEQPMPLTKTNNQEGSLVRNEVALEKVRDLQKQNNLKNKMSSFKNSNRQPTKPNTAHSIYEKQSTVAFPTLAELPRCLSSSLNCTQPLYKLQTIEQPFISNYIGKSNVPSFGGEKSQNNQAVFFQNIVDLTKPASLSFLPNQTVRYEKEPAKMNSCPLDKAPERYLNNPSRRTRSSGLDASMELFDLRFADNEMKKRFKVAKYRFKIPQHNRAIRQLVSAVGNKLHFGQDSAIVHSHPTIPPNSDKHRIFVHCLRIQLGKRRFIDLQGSSK